MEANVNIFVATVENPSKGYWFKLPVDEPKSRQTLLSRGALTQADFEAELKISTYEAPFKIHEYESIKKLNDLVNMLKDVDMSVTMFGSLVHAGIVDPFDSNLNADYLNQISIIKAEDEKDLAYEVIEQMGGVSELSAEQLQTYFDYDFFGKDLIKGGDYTDIGGGNYVGN